MGSNVSASFFLADQAGSNRPQSGHKNCRPAATLVACLHLTQNSYFKMNHSCFSLGAWHPTWPPPLAPWWESFYFVFSLSLSSHRGKQSLSSGAYFEGRGHDLPEHRQHSFETWTWACVVHSQAVCAWSLQNSHRPVSLLRILMKLLVPRSKLFELLGNISFPCLLLPLSAIGTLASGNRFIVITWWVITVNQLFHPHHPLWEKAQQSGRLISGTGQVFKERPCIWLPGMKLDELLKWSFSTNFCLLEFSSWRAEARKESWHSQCGGRVVPEWAWGFICPPGLLFPLRACPELSSTTQKREVPGPWEERGAWGRSVSWKLGRRAACCCVFSPTASGWAGNLRSKNKRLFFSPWETSDKIAE